MIATIEKRQVCKNPSKKNPNSKKTKLDIEKNKMYFNELLMIDIILVQK